MKKLIIPLIAMAAATSLSQAQVGYWSDAGLTPRTPTIYVNANTNYNNDGLETGDITITANGNVALVWEDDLGAGPPLTDFEAQWTVYNSSGTLLTPAVTITNIAGSACLATAESLTNCTFRAFFRSDGSPTPLYTGDYGGKLKGNQFGNGLMFCAGCDAIACEVPEMTAINVDNGGTATGGSPVTQLLNNDGTRNAALGGPDVPGIISFADADVEAAGTVRPGDVEFLANGNFLIVGESRQADDRALTGQTAGNVVVYKVLNSTGGVVHAYDTVNTNAVGSDIWHGTAATANGFAVRWDSAGAKIRLFDNNGNPQGPVTDLATLTGHPEAGAGGKGDGCGFGSNGKDAYAIANSSTSGPWVTVLNADGTVRYSRSVTPTNDLGAYANSDRMGVAINRDGRVVVAFDAFNNDTNNPSLFRLTQAVILDPCGNPMGPVFYVSETENATNAVAGQDAGRPRVAWRGDLIAVMWGSKNDPDPTFTLTEVLALRLFNAPAPLGPTVQLTGGNVTITWTGCGVLQQSSDLVAWADVSPTAVSPYTPSPLAAQKFYRLRY